MDTVNEIRTELNRNNLMLRRFLDVAECTYKELADYPGATPQEYELAATRYLKLRNAVVSVNDAIEVLRWFIE